MTQVFLLLFFLPFVQSIIPRIRYFGDNNHTNGRPWDYAAPHYGFPAYALNWLSYSFVPRPDNYLKTGDWVGGELSEKNPYQWPAFVKSPAFVPDMPPYVRYVPPHDWDHCQPPKNSCVYAFVANEEFCPYVSWDTQFGFTNHTRWARAMLYDHVVINEDDKLAQQEVEYHDGTGRTHTEHIFSDSLTDYENRNTFYRFIESSFTGAKIFDGCYETKPVGEHPITLQSVIHPAGEPYPVQCTTCSRNALRTGQPKSFWMLHNRNPFQPFNQIKELFDLKLDHNIRTTVAAALYIWNTRTTWKFQLGKDEPVPGSKPDRSYMWTLWEDTKEYADKLRIPQHTKLRSKSYQAETISNTRALYFAERLRERIVGFDNRIRFRPPDGRLFVDPDPAGYGEMITQWNGATFGCSEIVPIDGTNQSFYRAPQVMVNADTLIRPYWFLGSSEGEFTPFKAKARGAVFDYWRIGHMQHKNKAPETMRDTESNLQLRMHWEPWSLCSACCCATEDDCDGLVNVCDEVKSIKRRRGYAVLSKIHHSKPIGYEAPAIQAQLERDEGSDEECKSGRCQWEELNRKLSFSPYREEGIPCFSTLLLNMRYMNIYMALAPMRRFPETPLLPFHTYYEQQEKDKQFGMYYQVTHCTKEEKNCTNWWEQRRKLYGDYEQKDDGHGGKDTDGSGAARRQHPCVGMTLHEIEFREKEQAATVIIGQSYVVRWVDREGRNTIVVRWTRDKIQLRAYDNGSNCGEQHLPVFVDPNGRDLLMIKIQRNDVGNKVFIANGDTLKGAGETRRITFTAKRAGLDDPKLAEIFTWLGVIGGVLVLFAIGACLLYIFGRGTKKGKKKGEKSKGEEGTDKSTEDKNK